MFEVKTIPVDALVPTPDNTRTVRPDDAHTLELAKSMEAVGLLHPVVCRPHPKQKGKFDLRAGERRWIAAKHLGWKEIAASVDPDMTDEQAAEITAIENIQREDLTPMEEARSIAMLRDQTHLDFETIAAKIGKTPAYCARRASLLNLSASWMKSLDDGKFDGWTGGHLELVARLAESTQEALHRSAIECFETPSYVGSVHVNEEEASTIPKLADWRRIVSAELMAIDQMPWDPNDVTLDPKAGACSECPKQTAKQTLLFADAGDGDAAAGSRCLDRGCYEHKATLTVRRSIAQATEAADGKKILFSDHDGHGFYRSKPARDDVAKIEKGMQRVPWGAKLSDKPGRGRKPVVVTAGPNVGAIRYVATDGKTATAHDLPESRKKTAKKEDTRSPAQVRKERMARLVKRRQTYAIELIRKQIDNLKFGPATERHVNTGEALKLAVVFGFRRQMGYVEGDSWKQFDKGLEHIGKMAWDLVAPTIVRRLDPGSPQFKGDTNGKKFAGLVKEAQRFCEQLALDWDDAMKQAETAVADPQWLQNEKAATPAVKRGNSKKSKSKKQAAGTTRRKAKVTAA